MFGFASMLSAFLLFGRFFDIILLVNERPLVERKSLGGWLGNLGHFGCLALLLQRNNKHKQQLTLQIPVGSR